MKILVTGGAGYVGSVLVPYLLRAGHLVTVIDNFMYNQTPLLMHCYSDNFEIIRGDVITRQAELLNTQKFDCVIPLAFLTGAPLCDQEPDKAQLITNSITELCSRNEFKIIYPTTNSGYGIGEPDQLCTEESPLKPISLYGRLKCHAEKFIIERGNSISLRLATAFGLSNRMRLDLLVNDFVYRACNDGYITLFQAGARRNFIHVQDIARAFMHCIDNWETMKDNTYNLGLSTANLSKRELCHRIKKQIPELVIHEDDYKEDPDKRDYIVSNEKIEATGFKPIWTLDTGIKELIKGYQIIKRKEFSNV